MNEQSRDVRAIQLPRWGRVATDPGVVPWLVFDEEGKVVQPVRRFLIDFIARDNRTGSVRSYAYDLLRWWRWLHEHACIRCPVLQIDPRQRGRLIEIIQNLRDRIREARGNGWLGEVEGLQASLDAATAKLNSLKNTPADGRPQLVDLGMPVFTDNAPTPQLDTGKPGLPG